MIKDARARGFCRVLGKNQPLYLASLMASRDATSAQTDQHADRLPWKESGTPLITLPGRERKRGQFVRRFRESLPRPVRSGMLVKRVEASIDLEPIQTRLTVDDERLRYASPLTTKEPGHDDRPTLLPGS